MSLPSLFIGSSTEGIEIARRIAGDLENRQSAEVTVWEKDVFKYGKAFLDDLLFSVTRFDFAAFLLTPDDVIRSRGAQKNFPRDNVLFESGLFMGKMGRERAFLIRHKEVKMPSDLAGISLFDYDPKLDRNAAVRRVCNQIDQHIQQLDFRQLAGEWGSIYRYPYTSDHPVIEEDVEITPSFNRIRIVSKTNPEEDFYEASGDLFMQKYFAGTWQATGPMARVARAGGAFFLSLDPLGDLLYGFYAAPSADAGVTHGAWVLAKKSLKNDKWRKRLDDGIRILARDSSQLRLSPLTKPRLKAIRGGSR